MEFPYAYYKYIQSQPKRVIHLVRLHAFDSIRRTSRQRKKLTFAHANNTLSTIRSRYIRVIHHRTCMDMNMVGINEKLREKHIRKLKGDRWTRVREL